MNDVHRPEDPEPVLVSPTPAPPPSPTGTTGCAGWRS